MASNSLIPATTRALVPTIPRRHLSALESVYGAALIAGAFMDAAGQLAEKASDDASHLAILHEAQIKIAPLADGNLEQIRNAYGEVAVHHIRQMRGL